MKIQNQMQDFRSNIFLWNSYNRLDMLAGAVIFLLHIGCFRALLLALICVLCVKTSCVLYSLIPFLILANLLQSAVNHKIRLCNLPSSPVYVFAYLRNLPQFHAKPQQVLRLYYAKLHILCLEMFDFPFRLCLLQCILLDILLPYLLNL